MWLTLKGLMITMNAVIQIARAIAALVAVMRELGKLASSDPALHAKIDAAEQAVKSVAEHPAE